MPNPNQSPTQLSPELDAIYQDPYVVARKQEIYGQDIAAWYSYLPPHTDGSIAAVCLENPASFVNEEVFASLSDFQKRLWAELLGKADMVVAGAMVTDVTKTWEHDENSLHRLHDIVSENNVKPESRVEVGQLIARASRLLGNSYAKEPVVVYDEKSGRIKVAVNEMFYTESVSKMESVIGMIASGERYYPSESLNLAAHKQYDQRRATA